MAHWVAKVEGMTSLELKAALIAFHCLPGKHNGKAIAEAVMELLDRAHITIKVRLLHEAGITMHISDISLKVGHFTLDNASNNGTMMQQLEEMLKKCDVAFEVLDCRVMCFAHIIDLCSGQVVGSAESTVGDNENDPPQSDDEIAVSSPIAHACNVVQGIWGSSMH